MWHILRDAGYLYEYEDIEHIVVCWGVLALCKGVLGAWSNTRKAHYISRRLLAVGIRYRVPVAT